MEEEKEAAVEKEEAAVEEEKSGGGRGKGERGEKFREKGNWGIDTEWIKIYLKHLLSFEIET